MYDEHFALQVLRRLENVIIRYVDIWLTSIPSAQSELYTSDLSHQSNEKYQNEI